MLASARLAHKYRLLGALKLEESVATFCASISIFFSLKKKKYAVMNLFGKLFQNSFAAWNICFRLDV